MRQGQILKIGGNVPYMQFVDKTTMGLTTTLTGSVQPDHFHLDNLTEDLLFGNHCASPYGLYRIPIPASGTTFTTTHSNVFPFIYSNILNFGPYQYIGLVRTDLSPKVFQMYMKSDLTVAGVPLPTQSPVLTEIQTLVQGPSEGNKFFLAYQALTSGYNFQSYYIQFDLCTSRAGGQHTNGICPSCPTGYYLSEVNVAGNQCYPNGWGSTSG